MDAYIISLNNPTSLINQVSELGLNPILVNGVNGKQLTNKEINKNTTLLCSLFCPKSVIGIAMAHIKVWDTFLKTNSTVRSLKNDLRGLDINTINNLMNSFFNNKIDYDVLLLSSNTLKEETTK
jgi:hypothetical protein